MKMTGKQLHVLRNLERVTERPYKIVVQKASRRYNLDGWECTAQVTGLTIRGAIERLANGCLVRRAPVPIYVT